MLNIFYTIIITIIVIEMTTLNTILTKEAIQRELTFSEIINENQDTKLGKFFMIVSCIPTYIILYIRSLFPVHTKSCFNEEDFEEVES